jgi:cob(I)alamin adenosyltransferase
LPITKTKFHKLYRNIFYNKIKKRGRKKETMEKEKINEMLPEIQNNSNSTKALVSGIDVLRNTELIKPEDFEFLHEHIDQYEKRFRTRGLFRSKTEMVAGVLNDFEHPTVDSKYWQAIGEQNVHLTELINLSYESKKMEADNELLIAEIEELNDQIEKGDNPIEIKKLRAKLKKKRVELAQAEFGMTQQRKTAQERLREVKTWEGIIDELEKNLEFGSEDFELHHGKRYLLRYQQRMENLQMLDPEARESVVTNYKAFAKYAQTDGQVLPIDFKPNSEPARAQLIEFPDGSKVPTTQINYATKEEMGQEDPNAKAFFDRKVRKIIVAAPHRNKNDRNATNFFAMQTPTAFNCDLDEPYGMTVPDARNYIVKKAIEEEYDFIFFVDDDTIIPRNALVQLVRHMKDVKVGMAGGFYYKKYLPLESVGMHVNEKDQPIPIDDYVIGDIIHNTLVLPSGCTLIRVDMLKELDVPWYKTITVNDRPTLTEDSYLCSKLQQSNLGYDVITDTGLQCIHVDYTKGLFYGHPDIIDYEKNEIKGKYRDYFAI